MEMMEKELKSRDYLVLATIDRFRDIELKQISNTLKVDKALISKVLTKLVSLKLVSYIDSRPRKYYIKNEKKYKTINKG